MRYLEERGYGLNVGVARVPTVPAAIIFDLNVGDPKVRPGAEEGYQACLQATERKVEEGSIGAGTGARVGKILGNERATKSGIGTASCRIGEDVVVAAIMAVNSFGDVVNPSTGEIIAGPRQSDNKGFLSTTELMKGTVLPSFRPSSTTIGVVATNASLTKEEVNKLAQVSHSGLAQAVRPCHTIVDGDTIFALSLAKDKEKKGGNILQLGAIAAEVVAEAIVRAVIQAESLAGIPASKDIRA
jgi:L-aminopeptidase/D-esterase-like protein